jgi:hypothetical protein
MHPIIAKKDLTEPCKIYEIKASEGNAKDWTRAIRTRNVWNTELGGFVAYDQFVTDVREITTPENAIGCDYCNNDGKLDESGVCPKCDAQWLEEDQ